MTCTLETARLRLRAFEEKDRGAFAAMNADPDVMAHFPAPLTRAQSDAVFDRMLERSAEAGNGFGAIELREDGAFAGMAGLNRVAFAGPVQGMTEIGWRLPRQYWGQGIASEAAKAWLDHGFGELGLERIVSFTVAGNTRSLAVMRRIGLSRIPDLDFEHPLLAAGHPLRPHVVYGCSVEERGT